MTVNVLPALSKLSAQLPSLPAKPEESWRRSDPSAFFLPDSELLDFAGKPVLEALAHGARPWKISFADTGTAQSTAVVKSALETVLSAESALALASLDASRTAFVFAGDGFARVITPARETSKVAIEIAGVPVEPHAVVPSSAIGEALAFRLRAAVPQSLTITTTRLSQGGFATPEEDVTTLVVVAGGSPAYSQSHNYIRYVAAEGCKVDILHIDAGAGYAHHRHDVLVARGAEVRETWMHVGSERQESASQLFERRVEVSEAATLRDALIFSPSGSARVISNVVLGGEKAQAHCSTVIVVGGGTLDYEPVQEHVAPGGASDLRAKMVVSGRGRAVFQGLVVVRKEAPRTDAVQINKNLVLSKRARIDSLPRLEILPNEVSCKHGSATGEIDARQLYYLSTRGFTEEQGKALVIRGFALEGVAALPQSSSLFPIAEDAVSGLIARVVKV